MDEPLDLMKLLRRQHGDFGAVLGSDIYMHAIIYLHRLRRVTVKQAAARLEISQSLVYELLMAGKLRGSRHGLGRGTWRISEEQLQDYIRQSEPKQPKPVRLKWIR